MTTKIELPCALGVSDVLTVTHDDMISTVLGKGLRVALAIPLDVMQDRIDNRAADGDIESDVYLTEAMARDLFNWLGVWLHGGNRG